MIAACALMLMLAVQLTSGRLCKQYYTSKQYDKALTECRNTAEAGNAQAMYYLAGMYEYGLGDVGKNTDKARKWLKHAAEHGYTEAMYWLGRIELTSDKDKGLCWLLAASKRGHEDARVHLAFATGESIVDNLNKHRSVEESDINWSHSSDIHIYREALKNVSEEWKGLSFDYDCGEIIRN